MTRGSSRRLRKGEGNRRNRKTLLAVLPSWPGALPPGRRPQSCDCRYCFVAHETFEDGGPTMQPRGAVFVARWRRT